MSELSAETPNSGSWGAALDRLMTELDDTATGLDTLRQKDKLRGYSRQFFLAGETMRSASRAVLALRLWASQADAECAALRARLAQADADTAKAKEDAMMTWECVDMARDTLGSLLKCDPKGIAPMFLSEAICRAIGHARDASRGSSPGKRLPDG